MLDLLPQTICFGGKLCMNRVRRGMNILFFLVNKDVEWETGQDIEKN